MFDMRRRTFITLLGGAAAAWPLAANAQQTGAMPRIGFLSVFAESDPEGQALIRELIQRLQELGWTNGRNVQVEFRFAGEDAARISTLASELIELRPDVVLAFGALAATALRQQTLSIPIVFVQVVDPVSAGFVTNLARPKSGPNQPSFRCTAVAQVWTQSTLPFRCTSPAPILLA
jgi:putative tryptophan/tyrosine transport system substrate-binding protein